MPLAYSEAGIPHFWRVETQESGALALTVHTFVLDGSRYVQVGEHAGRLTVATPFALDIVLSELTR